MHVYQYKLNYYIGGVKCYINLHWCIESCA